MLRRRWLFVEELLDTLPFNPGEYTERECSREIRRQMIDTPGTLDYVAQKSVRCVASIFSTILIHDSNVVTPQNIENKIELDIRGSDGRKPSIKREVPTWLGIANFETVDTEHCNTQFGDFDRIYVAPVAPKPHRIVSSLGNRFVISDKKLCQIVSKSLAVEVDSSVSSWADRFPEISSGEVDAFIAAVKTQFDEQGWVQIEFPEIGNNVWVDLDNLQDSISERKSVISDRVLNRTLVNHTVLPISHVSNSDRIVLDDFLNSLKEELKEKYGWGVIKTRSGKKWCTSNSILIAELWLIAKEHQEVVNNVEFYSQNSIETSLEFFEQNKELISEALGKPEGQIRSAIIELRTEIEAGQFFERDKSAVRGREADQIETDFDSVDAPTSYGVAHMREEELRDDDDEERDDGTGGVRF